MLFCPATQDFDQILKDPALQGAQVGVCVLDESGNVLFERDSESRFVPASNQKVLSLLYAFEVLGPEYRGKTMIWKSKGRVDVQSSGDLTLTLADLRKAKKALGLTQGWPVHIRCPFPPSLGPGWEWDDLPWYYAAPISPVAFDRSSFEVWANKGRLEVLPSELRVVVVRNRTKPASVTFEPSTNTLTVNGPLPQSRASLGRFAQPQPLESVARALGGRLVTSRDPLPARPADLTILGKPLADGAKECLEKSDNNMAEQALAIATLKPGEWLDSAYPTLPERLRTGLAKASGVSTAGFRSVDGGGLSRHNQIAPKTMSQLLNWALTRKYRSPWLEALAAAGEGTMKKRLKDSSFVGKTGTMDAVVCLCGYLKTSNGKLLTLSFMVNNNLAPASEVRSVQDRFVRAIEKGFNSNDPRKTVSSAPANGFPEPSHRPSHGYWLP